MGPTEQNTTPNPEPVAPVQPSVTGDSPQAVLPVQKSKKGLLIGLISAGVLVLALAGAAVGYFVVYSNPDTVVTDAFMKMMTAKNEEMTGTMTMKVNSGTSTATFKSDFTGSSDDSGQQMTEQTITYSASGQEITLKTQLALAKDSVYVKLNDLNALIDKLYGADPSMSKAIKQYYGKLLDKIDSKWVVLKYSDLDSLTSGAIKGSQVTCVVDQMNKLKTDSAVQNEIKDIYVKNRFIKAESKGSDANGNRYTLTMDKDKAKDFGKALKETKFFKAIDDCVSGQLSKSTDSESSSSSSASDFTADIWVDGFSHNPNKIAMTAKGSSSASTTDMTMEYKPKLNTGVKVTIPTAQTTVDDIKTEIESIQQQLMSSYSTQSSDYTY